MQPVLERFVEPIVQKLFVSSCERLDLDTFDLSLDYPFPFVMSLLFLKLMVSYFIIEAFFKFES